MKNSGGVRRNILSCFKIYRYFESIQIKDILSAVLASFVVFFIIHLQVIWNLPFYVKLDLYFFLKTRPCWRMIYINYFPHSDITHTYVGQWREKGEDPYIHYITFHRNSCLYICLFLSLTQTKTLLS